jgi:hypothetical protein
LGVAAVEGFRIDAGQSTGFEVYGMSSLLIKNISLIQGINKEGPVHMVLEHPPAVL